MGDELVGKFGALVSRKWIEFTILQTNLPIFEWHSQSGQPKQRLKVFILVQLVDFQLSLGRKVKIFIM